MGASVDQADQWRAGLLREVIVKPLIRELEARGWLFNGSLTLDILVDRDNVATVLEMNTHIGDPEFRAALRATRLDVGKALRWIVARKSAKAVIMAHALQATAEVVIASQGYPAIRPVESLAEAMDRALRRLKLPHGSTVSYGVRGDGVPASGRIFAVGSISTSMQDAAKAATTMAQALVTTLRREGVECFARTDIGYY
jgi:phosphoribosylamine-glycine ligase